jgi:hypothetical protein
MVEHNLILYSGKEIYKENVYISNVGIITLQKNGFCYEISVASTPAEVCV